MKLAIAAALLPVVFFLFVKPLHRHFFLKALRRDDEEEDDDDDDGDRGDPENVMFGMDRWTKKLVTGFVPKVLAAEPILDSELEQPTLDKDAKINTNMRMGSKIFENLNEDVSFGNVPMAKLFSLKVLQCPLLFPIEDRAIDYTDEEGAHVLSATKIDQAMPKPNLKFDEMQSDKAMTRIAFFGVGSHRLATARDEDKAEVPGAAFVVDIYSAFLPTLEVRPGFERYGSKAYFDKDLKPVGVKMSTGKVVGPDEGAAWEHAKFAWRVNLLGIVTVVDHLFNLHFYVAAQMCIAMVHGLRKDNALRRALQPFTFRTPLINNTAGQALIPKQSLVHHMYAFTFKSLEAIADATYKVGKEWMPLPKQLEERGEAVKGLTEGGKLPYFEDGVELFSIMWKYFDSVIEKDEKDISLEYSEFWSILREKTGSPDIPKDLTRDALVDLCAQFAFSVTMSHEHVGAVTEYILSPSYSGTRIRPQAIRVDAQAWLASCVLMCLTGVRTPTLMSKFQDFWITEKEKECWDTLLKNLEEMADRVDARNKKRMFPYENGQPRNLECAVSV